MSEPEVVSLLVTVTVRAPVVGFVGRVQIISFLPRVVTLLFRQLLMGESVQYLQRDHCLQFRG